MEKKNQADNSKVDEGKQVAANNEPIQKEGPKDKELENVMQQGSKIQEVPKIDQGEVPQVESSKRIGKEKEKRKKRRQRNALKVVTQKRKAKSSKNKNWWKVLPRHLL